MATFALIHGAGDVGWYWHLLERVLRQQGHDVVAPDLPCDDDTATLPDYARTVVDAIGDRRTRPHHRRPPPTGRLERVPTRSKIRSKSLRHVAPCSSNTSHRPWTFLSADDRTAEVLCRRWG